MKRYIIVLVLSILTGSIFAQGASDALTYSQSYYMGTARSMAMGGSFGALGADLSVAATNPAGLGLYRVSEFSISTYFNNSNVHSNYFNLNSDGYKSNSGLSNVGYVYVTKLNPKYSGGWVNIQFAIGKNKINDFTSFTNIQGLNPNNSRIDSYINTANGTEESNLSSVFPYHIYPAWEVYLLNPEPGSTNTYDSPVPMGGVYQQDQHYRSGGVNEYYLSAAANFQNKLFIGATLGFNSLEYKDNSYYSETFQTDSTNQLSIWGVDQTLSTSGTGVNLKLGVIFQPMNWLRLGLAYHTSTWYYGMTDTWNTYTYANLPGYINKDHTSDIGVYNYSLKTPSSWLGDIGIIIGKRGSISAEIENVNYASMSLSAPDYSFSNENSDIRKYYRSVTNYRLGTEWRLGMMDVRAGYAYYASPYANNTNDGSREIVSGGVGFNLGNYSIGITALQSIQKEDYYVYTNVYNLPVSQNTIKSTMVVFSLNYRFY
ncbi:MAG: hypothetical protein JXR65_02115 [Bacteroidales bacterium]|nr:hypothetical protein [Bacteroidales bacterium]